MSTRALIIFENEKGVILAKQDGLPQMLGLNILLYMGIMSKQSNINGLHNFLVNGYGLLFNSSIADKRENSANVEYIYRITDYGLYVKGILTIDEEHELLFGDRSNYKTIIDKTETFRKLFLEDGVQYFIDIDGEIREVTR